MRNLRILLESFRAKFAGKSSTDGVENPEVFVGLASVPWRESSLKSVVESLVPQVSKIGVYLNNYDHVPTFLRHPKIVVARSQEFGDVKDNGKFFWVEKSDFRYYATVDDDIAYPSDYIQRLLDEQKKLGGTYAVGVHGTIYPRPVEHLFKPRVLFHFRDRDEFLRPVDMLGTGTLLFDNYYWQLKFQEFGQPGMADVWFAVAAKKRAFGLWSVPREQNWILPIDADDNEDGNLFKQAKANDKLQVHSLNESKVGSSSGSLLEQLVRAPKPGAAVDFCFADDLLNIQRKLQLVPLRRSEIKHFLHALVLHKQRANKVSSTDHEINKFLGNYVKSILEHLAGNESAKAEFLNNLQDYLDKHPLETDSLSTILSRDIRLLRIKKRS